ncbi:hypothetical protein, partial [Streptomyces antibioticus]|uniref:hypothetical protein n=1 Tax=Streptomyces antibioticus TaxID=1890 RepID=UPI0033D5C09C
MLTLPSSWVADQPPCGKGLSKFLPSSLGGCVVLDLRQQVEVDPLGPSAYGSLAGAVDQCHE